jgi:hypothetical protein
LMKKTGSRKSRVRVPLNDMLRNNLLIIMLTSLLPYLRIENQFYAFGSDLSNCLDLIS